MIDPDDAISEEEAQQALLEKLGLPSSTAAELAKKLCESLPNSVSGDDPQNIFLMDHPFFMEKVHGRYCISRKEFAKLLTKFQADPEILRLREEGHEFKVE